MIDTEVIKVTAHKFDAKKFYDVLFERNPELRSAFPANLDNQYVAMNSVMRVLVAQVDNPVALRAILLPLGKRHVKYGATPALYDTVGRAILESMELESGIERGAWATLFTHMRSIMLEGAAQVAEGATTPDYNPWRDGPTPDGQD